MSECNNEPCRFHIRQQVQVRAKEPVCQCKVSELHICILKPSQKPLNTSQVNKRNNISGVDRPIGNWDKKIAKLQKSTLNGHERKRAKQMTMAIILVVVTKAMLEKMPNIANKQNTTTTTKREK